MRTGYIEQFNSKCLSGWVRGEHPVKVTILIDDDEYEVETSKTRPDISFPSGAFLLEMPLKYIDRKLVKISIYNIDKVHLDNSPLVINLLKEERSKVLLGKENWLFLKNDANQSLKYLTGELELPSSVIDGWRDLTENRNKLCSDNNIDFISLVCPEKEAVYSSYLPESINISNSRPLNLICNKLNDCKEVNFLVPSFVDCSGKLSFSKGDTHWTYWGAYQAYTQLLERFFPELSVQSEELFVKSEAFQASDLLIKTDNVNIEAIEYWQSKSNIKCTYNNEVSNRGRRQEFVNNGANKKRVMIWHTSSIDWMKPFLFDSFSDVCLIWQQNISWDEVWRYNPDILIFQTNERFITTLPKDK